MQIIGGALRVNTQSFMIPGLEPDTSYQVRVLAGNTAGYPKYGNKDFWVKYRTPRGDARGKANLFFSIFSLQ